MRIRLFSLCAERDLSQRKLEAKIADSLHGFASNELEFEDFSSPQEMLAPLAQSLKNEALTVVAVERPAFSKIKKKLLPAMGYELTRNEKIYSKLLENKNVDEKKRESHSLFPAEAEIFETDDGLYSGFAIKKDDRFFMMLPLDKNRVPQMLSSQVIPFLIDNNLQLPEQEEEPEVTKKQAKAISSNPLVRSVNLLKEANSRVAFCSNKQEPIISEVISSIGVGSDLFLFSPHVEDRGDIDVVSYSVQLARAAKNLSHTELGAVISDPFDDENGRGVCISITDGEKAIARRFYAEEGESDESLVKAATEEAVSLLGQNAYGVLEGSSVNSNEEENLEKVAEKKTVKRALIALAIVLVLCIAAGIGFKILNDRRNAQPDPTTTSTTQTTEATTEEVPAVALQQSIVDVFLSRTEDQKVKKSDDAPEYFKKNGEQVDAKDTLALIVQANIDDDDNWNEEALKAMVVVTFTNLKYRNNGFDVSDITMANTADAKVKDAVNAVYGDYLTYKDEVIAALFHRASAGRTASAETVYGKAADYLMPMQVDSDARADDIKNEVRIDTTTLKNLIYKGTASDNYESSDPNTWIKVTKHDGAVDSSIGYVSEIQVADNLISGYKYIMNIDRFSKNPLPSACFTVSYDEEAKEFVFTTYGYGSGVGMSQRAAIYMGKDDETTYEDILASFYPGTELQKGEASKNTTEESTTEAQGQRTTARSSSNSGSNSSSNSGSNSGSRSNSSSTSTTPPTTTKAAETTTKASKTTTTTTTTKPQTEESADNNDDNNSDNNDNSDTDD